MLVNLFYSPTVFSKSDNSWKKTLTFEQMAARSMVQLVRNEYRMAIHITERLIACFKGDKEWNKKNGKDFRDKPSQCHRHKRGIIKKAKEMLPKMRILLALSMENEPYRPTGVMGGYSDRNLYQYPAKVNADYFLSEQNMAALQSNNILRPHIAHTFSTAKIPPLNKLELASALEILNTDLAWIYNKYGGPEPEKEATCFAQDKSLSITRTIPKHRLNSANLKKIIEFTGDGVGVGERACYYDKYLAMIFGGNTPDKPWTNKIEGFPLLAYFSSTEINDQTVIDALELRLQVTKEAKSLFESNYYRRILVHEEVRTPFGTEVFEEDALLPKKELDLSHTYDLFIYDKLATQLADGQPELADALDAGKALRKKKMLTHTALSIGAILAAIPICSNIFALPLAQGICMMPFGLGFNGYMVYQSEKKLRKAVNDMLMSPHGMRVLNHVDSLSDYQFSRNLDWMLLPVGTGIKQVSRGFKEFLKNR